MPSILKLLLAESIVSIHREFGGGGDVSKPAGLNAENLELTTKEDFVCF
jgi:hypothetical protein